MAFIAVIRRHLAGIKRQEARFLLNSHHLNSIWQNVRHPLTDREGGPTIADAFCSQAEETWRLVCRHQLRCLKFDEFFGAAIVINECSFHKMITNPYAC